MQRYPSCGDKTTRVEIRADKTIHYQWYGNYFYNANGIFEAGWYNEREGLGYYGRKASRLDVP